jgi:hemin uptake protein HemP
MTSYRKRQSVAKPDQKPPTSPIHPEPLQNGDSKKGETALPKLPKIISFDAIARCGDEVWIENEGQIYRLRKTRQGKLILTK